MKTADMVFVGLALLVVSTGLLIQASAELCSTTLVSPGCDDNGGVPCKVQCQRFINIGKVTATCVPQGCQCTVCIPHD
uniref:Predicted protein n=1 Tax=Hordeum vulgare subsp. vulgare TaxID=112509 RepID=F2ELJ0_HORVV|nr:predicted protein [Hordeum vulgare subsp. vulgare]